MSGHPLREVCTLDSWPVGKWAHHWHSASLSRCLPGDIPNCMCLWHTLSYLMTRAFRPSEHNWLKHRGSTSLCCVMSYHCCDGLFSFHSISLSLSVGHSYHCCDGPFIAFHCAWLLYHTTDVGLYAFHSFSLCLMVVLPPVWLVGLFTFHIISMFIRCQTSEV